MRRIINGASIDYGPAARKPSRKAPAEHHVYAIGDSDARYIKFGFARSPQKRLLSLQTGSPLQLRVLVAIQVINLFDAIEVERGIHVAAGRFHIRGEWFHSGPRTLMLVEWMRFELPKFRQMLADAVKHELSHAEKVNGGGFIRRSQEARNT